MSAERYRQYAHDCRRLAEGGVDPLTKSRLLVMAQYWANLADQLDKNGQDESCAPPRNSAS